MEEKIISQISEDLKISTKQVLAVLKLLKEDNTIPFIARYRKEATGGLDEVQINEIQKVYQYEVDLKKRKEDVCRLIQEKGMLTYELKLQIEAATKLVEVEDLYRPFKEKKKTKATEAIAKGLQPLADYMMAQSEDSDVLTEAEKYITEEVKKIKSSTLIIWGDQDRAVPLECAYELEKLIPDAGVVLYPSCSHYAYLEGLKKTINVVRVFLES